MFRALLLPLLFLALTLIPGASARAASVTLWADQGSDIVQYSYDTLNDTVTEVTRFTPPGMDISDDFTGLTYAPDRNTLFVVDGAGVPVQVSELALDGTQLNNFIPPSGSGATVDGLAYLPGNIYGLQLAGPTILTFNPDGTGLGSLTIGPFSRGLAARDGRLFVTEFFGNQIFELSPTDGSILNTIPAPVSTVNYGLAFDGTQLFLGAGNTVFRLNPDTGELLGSAGLPLPVDALAVAEGGPVEPIPEPGSLVLLLTGLAGVMGWRSLRHDRLDHRV